MILRATWTNPRRVDALGYSVFRVRLIAYVASGVLTGMAGFLLANLTAFASPSYMAWTVSGELIVMVVIGGLGNVLGPLLGALTYLLLEEGFKSFTMHWMLLMGPSVVLLAMLAKGGYGSGFSQLLRTLHLPATAAPPAPAAAAISTPAPTPAITPGPAALPSCPPAQTLVTQHLQRRFGGLKATDDG